MTSPTVAPAYTMGQPLDITLGPIHRCWVDEVRRILQPALDPKAGFWTRWAAARYLAGEFQEQLALERALLEELRPLLESAVAERLLRESDQVSELRLELAGIRGARGAAPEFAARVRRLLVRLSLLCSGIDLASHGVIRDLLTSDAIQLVAYLEAALQRGYTR